MFVDRGINDVTLLATLPEERGKGYGEALMWRATLSSPQLPAMLLSSDLGRRIYQRMAFLPLMRFTVWQRRFETSDKMRSERRPGRLEA